MKWLHKQVNKNESQLTSLFDFAQTSCFLAIFPAVFPKHTAGWEQRRCSAPAPPEWRTSALAVEFHGYTRKRYWEVVAPALRELRALYSGAGGTLLTATMMREPYGHLLSTFHMWPPYQRKARGAPKVVTPLLEWLPHAHALQAGSLLGASYMHQRTGWSKGMINPQGCAVLAEARRRLATFDLVGRTAALRDLALALESGLGWRRDEGRLRLALQQALKHKPHGVRMGGPLWRAARRWQLGSLSPAESAAVANATRCDAVLFADAVAP